MEQSRLFNFTVEQRLPTSCGDTLVAIVGSEGQPVLIDRITNDGSRVIYKRSLAMPMISGSRLLVVRLMDGSALYNQPISRSASIVIASCNASIDPLAQRILALYNSQGAIAPPEWWQGLSWWTIVSLIVVILLAAIIGYYMGKRRCQPAAAVASSEPLLLGYGNGE